MSPIRGRRRKQMQTRITTRRKTAITCEATGDQLITIGTIFSWLAMFIRFHSGCMGATGMRRR